MLLSATSFSLGWLGGSLCMAEIVNHSAANEPSSAPSLERQITAQPYGHIVTNTAAWSPDSRWIVYDVRSDPAGAVFDGGRIEQVNVQTGEVEVLYQSANGAYCGVATHSPVDDEVVFIHGPEHPTADWQYSFDHRRGVLVHSSRPLVATNLDARDLTPPFTPGALRGGTHVHVFSGDGQYVSFTYEDHVLARRDEQLQVSGASDSGDRNQRNVGISMRGKPVHVPHGHERNHDGESFSVLVTRTVNDPQPGSDEVSKAYDDAWVGSNGYVRPDGSRQRLAIAFLGDVISAEGKPVAELFVADIPDDVTLAGESPLQGTPTRRPVPPRGTVQRRLTYTSDRRHPGLSGPRQWPRSSADGSKIAFLMRDDEGIVQLWVISPNGGSPRQVSHHPFDIASAFSWHPDGNHVAYIADGGVWVTAVDSGKSIRLTADKAGLAPLRPEACVFSPDGRAIACVRPVAGNGGTHNQIFVAAYDPALIHSV
jgi:Protein of unknown function (DUF3748)/WD40-like Beta Propeller Repeat